MTRRKLLVAAGALAGAASAQEPPALPPPPRFGDAAPPRRMPLLCAHSANLARVPYFELGDIARQIGYEGVDLTVMIGGHVDPRITNVDLVRAFESIRGSGLEVPMVSTNIASPQDPTIFPVLYLTGKSQVPLFRFGYWPYGTTPIQQRLAQVRAELGQIMPQMVRSTITGMIHNRAGGFVGQSTWDAEEVIAKIDPRWVGYCFDPAEATAEGGLGGWEAALRLVLPRLRALVLQDFYWAKDGAEWRMNRCPLGEGMVDWQKFFSMVAAAGFTGPASLRMDYKAQDAMGAMAKDIEFARSQMQKAWASVRR